MNTAPPASGAGGSFAVIIIALAPSARTRTVYSPGSIALVGVSGIKMLRPALGTDARATVVPDASTTVTSTAPFDGEAPVDSPTTQKPAVR